MEEDILNYLYQLSCFVGHPVSGLLIYLELKVKSSFIRIIYNDIWIYFHESYSTLWSYEQLSSFLFVQTIDEALHLS